ncbi:uncharacterized protein fhdc2 [Electrophorus electricus]|uniref:uncharacterized protein fhdc2 n=1 Tax=Electrophorus electricus TaxID=8005 RepID=UPI0015D02CEB|nr:uncharacterized protein fhdc2 [Electrophorus electricus]XP_026864417.2 uncharacterized protein fhdc2 [Electrophorus electricus]
MRIPLHVDTKDSWAFHGSLLGRAGSQASVVRAMDTAPVPPPPILPPPPPPPPLPAPTATLSRLGPARRHRLRNLNWESIPKERVVGRRSVWSGSLGSDDDDDFPIDLRSLDELFGQKDACKPERADSLKRSLRHSGSPQESAADKVSLLDSKRSMNLGIFLRQFKIAVREIVADVQMGCGERYGAEKLTELCKLLPDSEEEARLKGFNGERIMLGEPDLFMLLLVEVPNFRLRLDAMILQQEFDPAVTSLCVAARCLGEAARELLSCHKLHSILRLVLKAGNYMNAGGYAGNAAGFRIASLLKLADTKANKPGMDLLHFVAMEAVKKDEDLLTFPSHLNHVSPASRLSEESVLEDLSRLRSRVAALRIGAQAQAEIKQQTRLFLEVADVRLKEAQEEIDGLRKTSQALVEFFCEDESSFKLEEACRIFHCFCHRFQRAVRENTERERQEQRRVARERESMEKLRLRAAYSSLDESDDLERTLTRNLSYTWSRRSLRKHKQQVPNLKEKSLDSQQSFESAGQDLSQVLSSEGCNGSFMLSRYVLIKDCNNAASGKSGIKMHAMLEDYAFRGDPIYSLHGHMVVSPRNMKSQDASSRLGPEGVPSDSPEESDIAKQKEPMNASCLTQLSKVLKVETQVHTTSEKLTQVMPDTTAKAEKPDYVDAAEASPPQLLSETRMALKVDTEMPSRPMAELWLGSCLPQATPQLAQELNPTCLGIDRAYPRLGETVECHTLVKGLRSYEAFTPSGVRPAPSHCSKWRKELEAEERDVASSPQPKEDPRALKALTRGPTKRGLATRSAPSSSTGIPKVHAKAELGLVEGPPTSRASRLTPARPSSTRTTPSTRPTGIQSELTRTSSVRDKTGTQVDLLGKQDRQLAEKAGRDKDRVLPGREPFFRGSPLRVSKRLAPVSESQNSCQPRTVHSPTAATNAKTIRTAVINAAKNKTTKNAEAASPKAMPGTRGVGTKIPRSTTQPMWR